MTYNDRDVALARAMSIADDPDHSVTDGIVRLIERIVRK